MFHGKVGSYESIRVNGTYVKEFKLDNKTFIFISQYIDSNYLIRMRKSPFFIMNDDINDFPYTYKDVRNDIMHMFGLNIVESSAIVHRYIQNKYKCRKGKKKTIFLYW